MKQYLSQRQNNAEETQIATLLKINKENVSRHLFDLEKVTEILWRFSFKGLELG